jgi:hypothetical protein
MLKRRVGVVIIVAGFAASALADDTILSFGFTDLSGSFDLGSRNFLAVGVDTPTLKTAGHVNRHLNPVGVAAYNPGTAANLVEVALDIGIPSAGMATGMGSIVIWDADGDRFQADIAGMFSLVTSVVFFNGILSNIEFVPGQSTNGMFDGPSGGSFPLTFAPAQQPLTGAIVQLHFDAAFFNQSFQDKPTQVHGGVIPTPGSLAILGFAGIFAARRRRSR